MGNLGSVVSASGASLFTTGGPDDHWGGNAGASRVSLENAAARHLPRGTRGERVSVNVRVVDLSLLPPGRIDYRKTEVADGLPLPWSATGS